jgi:hypothetical protein
MLKVGLPRWGALSYACAGTVDSLERDLTNIGWEDERMTQAEATKVVRR